MVCESLACPRISRSAGSETKKNRGNSSRFFSRYPVSDFWQISSCSSRCGSSWASVSSPEQHSTTLGISWARCIMRCHDLSMFENLFASCRPQHRSTAVCHDVGTSDHLKTAYTNSIRFRKIAPWQVTSRYFHTATLYSELLQELFSRLLLLSRNVFSVFTWALNLSWEYVGFAGLKPAAFACISHHKRKNSRTTA